MVLSGPPGQNLRTGNHVLAVPRFSVSLCWLMPRNSPYASLLPSGPGLASGVHLDELSRVGEGLGERGGVCCLSLGVTRGQ